MSKDQLPDLLRQMVCRNNDELDIFWKAADEIERLRTQVAMMREAISYNMALIKEGQEILRDQLIGPPQGLSDHRALNALHGVFDGPTQRAALEKAVAALATGGERE